MRKIVKSSQVQNFPFSEHSPYALNVTPKFPGLRLVFFLLLFGFCGFFLRGVGRVNIVQKLQITQSATRLNA